MTSSSLAISGMALDCIEFSYNGSDKIFVGVVAQEVQKIQPAAVLRGGDGYLRVDYDQVGVKFQSYDQWIKSGAHVPTAVPSH